MPAGLANDPRRSPCDAGRYALLDQRADLAVAGGAVDLDPHRRVLSVAPAAELPVRDDRPLDIRHERLRPPLADHVPLARVDRAARRAGTAVAGIRESRPAGASHVAGTERQAGRAATAKEVSEGIG